MERKHTKKLLLILSLILFFSNSEVFAQIRRGEWSYGIVLQSDNLLYSTLGSIIESIPIICGEASGDIEEINRFYYDNKWWIPQFRYRANVLQRMSFDNQNAILYPKAWGFSHWDWSLNNYSVGYHIGYLSRVVPLGFDFQTDYIQDGYKMKINDFEQTIIKRMLSATLLLKIRLCRYDSHRIVPVIEMGSSYNYALHYHDKFINDKNAVNNGFTGIIGLGFTNTETHISWSLRYEHSFYNYYNNDFIYQGEPIFAGATSAFGKLGAAITFGF